MKCHIMGHFIMVFTDGKSKHLLVLSLTISYVIWESFYALSLTMDRALLPPVSTQIPMYAWHLQ